MSQLARLSAAASALWLGMSVCHAESPPRQLDPAIFQLGSLFVEGTFSVAADLCSQRVPASKTAWDNAARQWREEHHAQLDALRKSQQAVATALKSKSVREASIDQGQFATFAAQGPGFIMYGLAGADDAKAYEVCETLRTKFLDRKGFDESFDQAQAAATAVLREKASR